MSDWTPHWLDAEGETGPWRTTIAAEIEAARAAVARLQPLPRLDVLICIRPDRCIPEEGLGGSSFEKSLFWLTLDPSNANFAKSLASGGIQRTVVHEVHHCLRWAGPGYGETLGEALVSEGLAGRFVQRVLGTPAELWERAVSPAAARAALPSDNDLGSSNYDHQSWFFGCGSQPRWLGYTVGYEMAGAWLKEVGEPTGEQWRNVPAQDVISSARRAWDSGCDARREDRLT